MGCKGRVWGLFGVGLGFQDDRRNVTPGIVTSLEGTDILVQLIVSGTTPAVISGLPEHASMLYSYSASHWTSTDTLVEVILWLRDKVKARGGKNFIFLMDCASTHRSRETMERIRAIPEAHVLFIEAGLTSELQPCDVAIMRPLKSALSRNAATYMTTAICEGEVLDLRLRTVKPLLARRLAAAIAEVSAREHIHQKAWAPLSWTPEELSHLEELAFEEWQKGILFDNSVPDPDDAQDPDLEPDLLDADSEPEILETMDEKEEAEVAARRIRATLTRQERFFYMRWVYGKTAPKPVV